MCLIVPISLRGNSILLFCYHNKKQALNLFFLFQDRAEMQSQYLGFEVYMAKIVLFMAQLRPSSQFVLD